MGTPGPGLGSALGGVAPRPALPATSPHSFVLARGSWQRLGPAAPPTGVGVPARWSPLGQREAGKAGVAPSDESPALPEPPPTGPASFPAPGTFVSRGIIVGRPLE